MVSISRALFHLPEQEFLKLGSYNQNSLQLFSSAGKIDVLHLYKIQVNCFLVQFRC